MAEPKTSYESPERRVAVRTASTQQAPCHFATIDTFACRWAQVRNLSPAGIGLCLDCSFEPGQQLIIELPSKALPATQSVPARVVHAVDRRDGTWIVGCVFLRPLTDEEFQALL